MVKTATDMAFSSVLQMYLSWANSLLCEQGVLIDGLHQLRDGTIFCQLLELLTGTQLLSANQDNLSDSSDNDHALDNVQTVLDHLRSIGVKISVSAADIIQGELRSILDVMWSIILHCTIHSPERAAYQRTVRIGRKLLLQYCEEQLGVNIDTSKSLGSAFSYNNHLSNLLSRHCTFDNDENNSDNYVLNLTNGILAVEDTFGIAKTLLGPADVINGMSDEHSIMIYIALLRRKVNLLTSKNCSFSSDEETLKISPKKEHSLNNTILFAANSLHSPHSSHSNLSAPHPPHHRYISDLNSTAHKPPINSSSQPTDQDILPDSGVSTSAETPSISSSSCASRTTGELRNRRPDIKDTRGATLSRTAHLKDRETLKHETNFSSRRSKDLTRPDDCVGDVPKMRDFGVVKLANYPVREGLHGLLPNQGKSVKQGDVTLISDGINVDEGLQKDDGNGQIDTKKDASNEAKYPVRTPDDELLNLLDTIGEESEHLRLELDETQRREAILMTKLEEEMVGFTKEERVISKLVQELEMLRTENRKLFRESANAKNANAQDRKTMKKLYSTMEKLQVEVDNQREDNFNLRMKTKNGDDPGSAQGSDVPSSASTSRDAPEITRSDSSVGSKESYDISELRRELVRVEGQKEFLQVRFKEIEEELKCKQAQTLDDLRATKLENLRLEKECQLLRMSNETSHLEVETVAGRCRRLEEYLSHAQRRNNKLVQQLEDDAFQAESQGECSHNFASSAKIEEENALLKEKLQLAEEEHKLLKQELEHFRLNKTTLDEVLRAWDVQTSNKFQAFLDDFRLQINEQRGQENSRTQHQDRNTGKVKLEQKQNTHQMTDNIEFRHSIRHASKKLESSKQASDKQDTDLSSSRESVVSNPLNMKLSAEKLAALAQNQGAVDDKYLKATPRRVDTDSEKDSEMDSQATDDVFSDLPNSEERRPNQPVAAGGIARLKASEGFRRPSLGDLIVAKAKNSPPDDDASRPEWSSSMPANTELKKNCIKEDDEISVGSSLDLETAKDHLTKSNLPGRTRFSAVNSSLESLRGITRKAKQDPGQLEENKGTTALQEAGQGDAKTKTFGQARYEKDLKLEPRRDNLEHLSYGASKVASGSRRDFRDQSKLDLSLQESEPLSFKMPERVGPVRGRLTRWRRMQSRFQPELDGSYLGETRVHPYLATKTNLTQKPDCRNRSSSQGSPLNSNLGLNQLVDHSQDSETETNSMGSDVEFASLPERRKITQDLGLENSNSEGEVQTEKNLHREKADGKDGKQIITNGFRNHEEGRLEKQDRPNSHLRESPTGSVSKPQFSSPQRLGHLRSKLGIKLEKELLGSNFRKNVYEEMVQPLMDSKMPPLDNRPIEAPQTDQSQDSGISSSPREESENYSKHGLGLNDEKSLASSDSPDTSKMSPESRSRYYKHKMMTEKDQEYANSIIEKYLGQM